MRTRIIGLGNPILTDDAVGILAAREITRRLATQITPGEVEVVESEVAGFALMELMTGWDRVFFVDSLQYDGVEPGTVLRLQPDDFRISLRLRSVHEIDLTTALGLGKHLGLEMPGEVVIYGVQAQDAASFGERLTSAAERGMHEAVDLLLNELEGQSENAKKRTTSADGNLSAK